MTKSTSKRRSRKGAGLPSKPYEGFPLTPHRSGMWQKKINGKLHYFGRWGRRVDGQLQQLPGDEWWRPALEDFQRQRDDLYAGRTPRLGDGEALTLKQLGDRFLTAKKRKVLSGELSPRTFQEYRDTAQRLADQFGKDRRVDDLAADDFEKLRAAIAENWGPVRLGNEITRVKSVFKYAFDSGLIDKPVRFGGEFHKPGKATLRKHKATGGAKVFTADEVHRLLNAASVPMKAMILLGVNCGFGNTDVADLQRAMLDLEAGWIDFPRPKTGIERRSALWPETVAALQAALAKRPQPKAERDADCVFITYQKNRWVRPSAKARTDNVSVQFGTLMRKLKINGRRGLGFYSLRHTFRTVADGTTDQVAANIIMGHADGTMADNYRHGIDDARLRAVADHVRAWLYAADGTTPTDATDAPQRPTAAQPDPAKADPANDDRPRLRVVG